MLDCLLSVVGNEQRTKKQQCQKEISKIMLEKDLEAQNLLHSKVVLQPFNLFF